jgi:hypothetical protein
VVQRADDAEDTVRARLRKYEEATRKPVSGFYSYTGLIRTVDAEGDIDEVTERMFATLAAGSGGKETPAKKRAPQRRAKPKAKARVRTVVRRKAVKKSKTKAKRAPARQAKRAPVRKARPARRKK